ncbi:hypothetical protein FGO68_gene8430 [Halteria grandinella]|uniref:Uncharacterized protein n=1 Tax=Halteria grandinella TaxID=5974 RepID=A0A8J8NVS3_HALGN|nr:hypothetical protein FGO68_gene8430 [Halteria grandinella]
MTCNNKYWSKMETSLRNNEIQQKQDLCLCTRGLIRFQCTQVNCVKHIENIFFCDDCFNEIMETGESHSQKLITKLFEELSNKWMALIEMEGKLYTQVDAKYNSIKQIIECLETQPSSKDPNFSRLVGKDKLVFDKFHVEFKNSIATYEQYAESQNVSKIYSLNDLHAHFHQTIDRNFSYMIEIGKPEFLYQNYKLCIEGCPLPINPDDASAREQILGMKVRLGEENILSASTVSKVSADPNELVDAVNSLNVSQQEQKALLRSFISLFGSLKDAANFINLCISSRNQCGYPLQEIKQQLNDQEQKALREIQAQSNDLKHRINRAEQAINKLDRVIISHQSNAMTKLPAFQKEIKLCDEKLSRQFRLKMEQDVQSIHILIDAKLSQLKFGSQDKKTANTTQLPNKPKTIQEQLDIQSQMSQSLFFDIQSLANIHPQAAAASNSTIQFTQEMLDRLLLIFNSPLNDCTPSLNANGQSKLTEYILQFEWKWSLEQLNSKADIERKVQWSEFEGTQRSKGWHQLKQGFYYGQMLDRKRHGYGIVYTTDTGGDPYYLECQWDRGRPIEGRYIGIWGNKWYMYEGSMDEAYTLSGIGNYRNENGEKYEGGYKEGKRNGQGRQTYPSGAYSEGEYWECRQVGIHKYYSKEGVLTKSFDHGQ